MTPSPPVAFRAAWIFAVSGAPFRDGIIEIDGDGRIADLRTGHDAEAIDLGKCAIVPALVNPHVHLEFSDLARPIGPSQPFPRWVTQVVAHRRQRSEPVEAILQRGLAELERTGTAAIGEIATSDAFDNVNSTRLHVTLFRELIGPLREQWPSLLDIARRHATARATSPNLRHGLSPHAPYTVPQELFERTVDLAVEHDAPIAVHLAETAAERDLLADGTGELVEMMRSLDLWRPELHPRGRRPLDWLTSLERASHGLVIHGNFLDDAEVSRLAQSRLTLVYCPRTHAAFGHPPHPFRRVIEQGGQVALATDGRSSNPDLDLWREAKFLRTKHPDLACDTILELITRRGAEALGIADRFGVLSVGRRADFLVVRLPAASPSDPPDLFDAGNVVTQIVRGGVAHDCLPETGPSCRA